MQLRHSSSKGGRSTSEVSQFIREKCMKSRYKLTALLTVVTVVCCGALLLNQKVSAAGEGKITGTVKLDGAAPHMKGIDMSKDPYCVKANSGSPAHLQT